MFRQADKDTCDAGSLARHTHRDAHLAEVVGRRAVLKGCRHSGPQGKAEPLTIIDDPADWKASDWEGRESEYTYRFTSEVCGGRSVHA